MCMLKTWDCIWMLIFHPLIFKNASYHLDLKLKASCHTHSCMNFLSRCVWWNVCRAHKACGKVAAWFTLLNSHDLPQQCLCLFIFCYYLEARWVPPVAGRSVKINLSWLVGSGSSCPKNTTPTLCIGSKRRGHSLVHQVDSCCFESTHFSYSYYRSDTTSCRTNIGRTLCSEKKFWKANEVQFGLVMCNIHLPNTLWKPALCRGNMHDGNYYVCIFFINQEWNQHTIIYY